MTPFQKRIAARRRKVAHLWAQGLTARQIAVRLLPDARHDMIIRQDLKRLGEDPASRKTKGWKRGAVEARLLAGDGRRLVALEVGCDLNYVHMIARDLVAAGRLKAERKPDLGKEAAAVALEVRRVGSVRGAARRCGLKEGRVYYLLNTFGYSINELTKKEAA